MAGSGREDRRGEQGNAGDPWSAIRDILLQGLALAGRRRRSFLCRFCVVRLGCRSLHHSGSQSHYRPQPLPPPPPRIFGISTLRPLPPPGLVPHSSVLMEDSHPPSVLLSFLGTVIPPPSLVLSVPLLDFPPSWWSGLTPGCHIMWYRLPSFLIFRPPFNTVAHTRSSAPLSRLQLIVLFGNSPFAPPPLTTPASVFPSGLPPP